MEKFLHSLTAMNIHTRHSYYRTGLSLGIPNLGRPLLRRALLCDQTAPLKMAISFIHFIHDKFEAEHRPNRPFHELRAEMTDIGDGIFKKTLKEGYGKVVRENTQITVHYTIFLEDQKVLLDSTYMTRKPYTYIIGKSYDTLPKFEKVLLTMRNQEKAEFIVPRLLSDRRRLPHGEELLDGYLLIEVIRVTKVFTRQQKIRLHNNFNQTLKQVQKLRDKGKAAFSAHFYHVAASDYIDAVYLLIFCLIRSVEDHKTRFDLLVKMCLNAGIVLNKINQPEVANNLLTHAVDFVENGVEMTKQLMGKLYLHTSRSYRLLNEHSQAFVYIKRAQDYVGDVQDIRDEFKSLCESYDDLLRKDFVFSKALAKSSNSAYESIFSHQDESIFGATFEHTIETFMKSQDKMWGVYGIHGPEYVFEARMVATKYDQVVLQIFAQDLGDVGDVLYILIRK